MQECGRGFGEERVVWFQSVAKPRPGKSTDAVDEFVHPLERRAYRNVRGNAGDSED